MHKIPLQLQNVLGSVAGKKGTRGEIVGFCVVDTFVFLLECYLCFYPTFMDQSVVVYYYNRFVMTILPIAPKMYIT